MDAELESQIFFLLAKAARFDTLCTLRKVSVPRFAAFGNAYCFALRLDGNLVADMGFESFISGGVVLKHLIQFHRNAQTKNE